MATSGETCGEASVEPTLTPAGLRSLLERIVGQAPFGFALYGPDLRYVMINDLLAELNGRPAQEHLGLTVYDTVPDLADQIAASLRHVIETGEPIIDREVVGLTPGRPGRRGIWLNSFYRVTGPDGELLGVAALARDVTEERRMQQQLETEQFRAALNASLQPVLLASVRTGRSGRGELWVEYLNPAAASNTGLRPEEAVGRRLTDLFPVVSELGLEADYERVYQTGIPFVARGLPSERLEGGSGGNFDVSVTRTLGGVLIAWRSTELEHRLVEQQLELLAERQRVTQLQRSFLPRHLPRPPGAVLAARYQSAERDAPLGGDWYDAVSLDGLLALAIGDVAGHGMDAVETMGVARITARAYLAEDSDPQELLRRLDRYAMRMTAGARPRTLMTMIAATYDPASRVLRWASAGHLPPLLVDRDGPRLLETRPQPPLGTGITSPTTHQVTLAPGSLLVLYTDGLIERRRESLDDGFARLVEAARDLPADARTVCEVLLERCLDPVVQDDDVCLVVLQTT